MTRGVRDSSSRNVLIELQSPVSIVNGIVNDMYDYNGPSTSAQTPLVEKIRRLNADAEALTREIAEFQSREVTDAADNGMRENGALKIVVERLTLHLYLHLYIKNSGIKFYFFFRYHDYHGTMMWCGTSRQHKGFDLRLLLAGSERLIRHLVLSDSSTGRTNKNVLTFLTNSYVENAKGYYRDVHEEELHNIKDCKKYLGKVFRSRFPELPMWATEIEIPDFRLWQRILIHLQKNTDKFNLLMLVVQKLYEPVRGNVKIENVDSVMMQDVRTPGM
uniref:Uncharacterized protein n=1 Tax=Glossina austeni TaxID=7395 RepID=A0A1A9VFQ2_GLOAU